MTIEKLLDVIREYNPEEEDIIKKAYEYAYEKHKGQYRESGEPYIIHPLNVAYSLAQSYADRDTVCAALLHDTLEDTETNKEELAHLFGVDVANLVDGVTKMPKVNFASKEARDCANIKKFFANIIVDVRVAYIKLFDNLDNMRTLEYKKNPAKQVENAIESQRLYVPIAHRLGAYQVKNELEDLTFKCINPEMYKRISEIREKAVIDSRLIFDEMKQKISSKLDESNFNYEISSRVKNIYGIHKQLVLHRNYKVSDIHDLLSLKIKIGNRENPGSERDCFSALCDVHSQYNSINSSFKNYIHNTKDNGYQSLHTTLFSGTDWLVQTQIRTWYMDLIASYGLSAYWYLKREMAKSEMLKDFKDKFPVYLELEQILENSEDDFDFCNQFIPELSSNYIHIYFGETGKMIEIPSGFTVTDVGFMQGTDFGNMMVSAMVKGINVPFEYELKTNDRLIIKTDPLAYGSKAHLLDKCHSIKTKKLINNSLRK